MDTTRKQAAWLISVVMVAVAGGCAGCPMKPDSGPAEPIPTSGSPSGNTTGGVVVSGILPMGCTDPANDCGTTETTIELDDQCPTGDCKPGGLNGKGIYNVEESNYCFLFMGELRFCPEAFVNTKDGVQIEVRDLTAPNGIVLSEVTATLQENGQTKNVVLRGITSDKSQFAVRYAYDKQGKDVIAKGTDLQKLKLRIGPYRTGGGDASPLATYEMQVVPVNSSKTAQDNLQRYQFRYREIDSPVPGWLYHCKAKADADKWTQSDVDAAATTFLEKKRINATNAKVTTDDNVTTLACEKGAIATCMSWGFTPWNPKPGSPAHNDYALGSCLQAKRAAFFVQFKDLTTYTVSGTPLLRRDQFGVTQNEVADRVEAMWSPWGATCINTENLRRTRFKDKVAQLKKDHNIPSCAQPPVWTPAAKLATSPQDNPAKW